MQDSKELARQIMMNKVKIQRLEHSANNFRQTIKALKALLADARDVLEHYDNNEMVQEMLEEINGFLDH